MKRHIFLCLIAGLVFSGCQTVPVKVTKVKVTDMRLEDALSQGLNDAQLCEVFEHQFNIRLADGGFYAVLDILPLCIQKLSVDGSYKALDTLFRRLLKQKKYDDLERLVAYLTNMFPNSVGLQELCIMAEIDYLSDTDRIDKAVVMLITQASELSDLNMRNVVQRLLVLANDKRDFEMGDQICAFVVTKTHGKSMSLDAVALPWVTLAHSQKKLNLIPSRLSSLLVARTTPSVLAQAYVRFGWNILMGADKKTSQLMIEIGQSLLTSVSPSKNRTYIARLMLDYSYITEDYEESLRLIKICHEGKNVDLMLNKVLAHKALKDGHPEEAIKRFRDFMNIAKTWETRQYDPSTGETVPMSAVLGLNAMRIGDILFSIGKKKDASLTYAEAKEYYLNALDLLNNAPRWKADVLKAIKELEMKHDA